MHKKLIANSDFENERKIAEIQKQIELEEKKARKNKTIKTRTKNFHCNVFGLLLLWAFFVCKQNINFNMNPYISLPGAKLHEVKETKKLNNLPSDLKNTFYKD